MRAAALLAVAVLAAGCGGAEEPSGRSLGAEAGKAPAETRTGEARIADSALGSLERENLGLQLAWTVGVVNRDPTEGAGPATVREVAVEQVAGVDRVMLTFDADGGVPGYQVRGSVDPATACATGDTLGVAGEGVLIVRLRNTSLAEDAGTPAGVGERLRNMSSLHLACEEDETVEWVIPVSTATAYRVVEASNPPRLVVDVRHPDDEESGTDGAGS